MNAIGRFELLDALGSGGVAEVWRARDTKSGRQVALKRLLPQLADDRQIRRRFLREAEVARRLDHPNIVRVLETGGEDNQPFLVMELVAGEDLSRRIEREGRLPPEESWRIALAVAQALGHAHARGIVHRDVKPQNVLLEGATVKLADFGVARVETLASLTGSSLVWGSPEYMAPELFGRGRADPRTDLFSFGVMLHEMVTGRLPWKEGRSAARLVGSTADSAPGPFELGHGVPLDRLVTALLAPSPDDRPSSAAEVIAMLKGQLPVAPLVRVTKCADCGRPLPEDVPRCFACGKDHVPLRHVTTDGWDVLLTKMTDDADSMAALHEVLTDLTGREDLKLKFLLGNQTFYSEAEKQRAIKIPVVLFADLDQAAAREIERRLVARGLRARAAKRRVFGAWTFQKSKAPLVLGAGISFWGMASMSMIHQTLWVPSAIFALAVGGMIVFVPFFKAARELARDRGLLRLRAHGAPSPAAERLLGEAHSTSTQLAAPEVRALFVDTARDLYRLTRRAEELARLRPGGTSEEALARRLLATAPALGARLGAVAARLETLEAALEGDSEGDIARSFAALDRRLASASNGERPALEAARSDLEAALDRRLAAETEREQLAASLCRTLATVRNLYHRAATLSTAEEREAAAIDAALQELEASL